MRLALTLVAVCMIAATTAAAELPPPAPYSPPLFFYSLLPDGTGELTTASEALSWQACSGPDATSCVPVASASTSVSTAGAPPGTVFVATASDARTMTSPVWHGNVVSIAPPTVHGAIRANALVTAIAGRWSGGWDVDFNSVQLAACADADGTSCTSLTPGAWVEYIYKCPRGAVLIDPLFAGRYLRVADQLAGSDFPPPPIPPPRLASSPYGGPVWSAGPTTSIAVVGRIARAAGPRTVPCGGPPLPPTANPLHPEYPCPHGFHPPACPVATVSRRGLADVWCGVSACHISIRVRRGSRSALFKREPVIGRPATFRPAHWLRRRLGPGPAIVTVTVNGRQIITSRITL